jgi:tetratricopeptide (TPR) repeat protein
MKIEEKEVYDLAFKNLEASLVMVKRNIIMSDEVNSLDKKKASDFIEELWRFYEEIKIIELGNKEEAHKLIKKAKRIYPDKLIKQVSEMGEDDNPAEFLVKEIRNSGEKVFISSFREVVNKRSSKTDLYLMLSFSYLEIATNLCYKTLTEESDWDLVNLDIRIFSFIKDARIKLKELFSEWIKDKTSYPSIYEEINKKED